MTWTRISDDWPSRPEIASLTDAAFRVHVEAYVWCNRNMTDGHIPADPRILARILPGAVDVLDELTGSVWRPDDDQYVLDWSDQEPADRVRRAKEYRAQVQQRYRDRKVHHDTGDHSLCDPRFCKHAHVTGNESNHVSTNVPVPVPSRPVRRTGTGTGATEIGAGAPTPAPQRTGNAAADTATDETRHTFQPIEDGIDACACGMPQANKCHRIETAS